MNIDGKTNVRERIKVFESNDFTTYLYRFENGNQYKDTVPKWTQTDFRQYVYKTPEERLENKLDILGLKRC